MTCTFTLAITCLCLIVVQVQSGGNPFGFGPFNGYSGLATINQQRYKLKGYQIEINNSINTANNTILDNIEKNQQSLKAEVDAAKSASNGVAQECSEKSNQILDAVNTDDLLKCDQANELQQLKLSSGQIYSFHMQLGLIYGSCPFYMPNSNQDQCIQDYIKPIDDASVSLRDATQKEIAQILDRSYRCVNDASDRIRVQIDGAKLC